MNLTSGEERRHESATYTAVFKKVAGQWRVIYGHDSGTLVIQKGGKK